VWDATERDARAFIAKIPDGVYEAESFLDNDGRTLDVTLRIKVKVTIDGERMIVDFSQMNDQAPGPTNSGYSGGLAAARVAFKCLTQPHAPVNEGCFRPLEIILPEGKIINAKPPAALGLWSIPLPTVIDTILKSLAPVLPEKIPAAHKGDMGGCSISGYKPDGRRFLLMNIFGGGWGGRPHEDGESASVSICQGDVRSAPIELQEIQYPFLIERFALRTDSGGAGRHRGGLGVDLTYRALQTCVANVNCERTKDPPWGLGGGKSGAVNEATLILRDGSERKLKKATGVTMQAGDRLVFSTAGGGGWGDPRTRQRQAVADDVRAGYVSAEAALRDYGFADAPERVAE
jgi:N-methylhydantoinase B